MKYILMYTGYYFKVPILTFFEIFPFGSIIDFIIYNIHSTYNINVQLYFRRYLIIIL